MFIFKKASHLDRKHFVAKRNKPTVKKVEKEVIVKQPEEAEVGVEEPIVEVVKKPRNAKKATQLEAIQNQDEQ